MVAIRLALKWWHQSGFALKKLSSKLWWVIYLFLRNERIEVHVGWAAVIKCVCVGRLYMCEIAMKVEWDLRLTQPSLRVCNMGVAISSWSIEIQCIVSLKELHSASNPWWTWKQSLLTETIHLWILYVNLWRCHLEPLAKLLFTSCELSR